MKEQGIQKRRVAGLGPLLAGGMAFGLGMLGLSADESQNAGLREWTSENGKFSVTAKLESYDAFNKKVILRKGDSSLIKVPLARLSFTDWSFVEKHAARSSRSKGLGKTIKLHGIQWHPEVEGALTAAAGGPSPSDDQPVMWFRVLGQLDDGM